MKPGKTTKASAVAKKARKKQSSKYDEIVAKVLKLRKGQGFEVPKPRSVAMLAFRNNLANAIRRKLPAKLKGKIRCNVTSKQKSVLVSRIA